MKTRLLHLTAGLTLTAALTVLLLRVVDTSAVAAAIAQTDARLIPLGIGVHLLAMWLRSVLWQRLLPTVVPTFTLFRASLVGFTVSYLLPLRVGEIARAFLLARWAAVDYGTTTASLIAERVLDGLAVAAILLVGLLFVPAAPPSVVALGVLVAGVFGVLAVLLLAASWRAGTVVALVAHLGRWLPARMHARVEALAGSFAAGLVPLRNWRALPLLFGLALSGWLCQFAVFYVLMFAFPIGASLPAAVLGGAVANFATLLPSAPGSVGTFDAALIRVVTDVQSAPLDSATAYALIVHSVVVIPIVVLGALTLWQSNLSIGQVLGRRAAPRPQPAAPGGLARDTRPASARSSSNWLPGQQILDSPNA